MGGPGEAAGAANAEGGRGGEDEGEWEEGLQGRRHCGLYGAGHCGWCSGERDAGQILRKVEVEARWNVTGPALNIIPCCAKGALSDVSYV